MNGTFEVRRHHTSSTIFPSILVNPGGPLSGLKNVLSVLRWGVNDCEGPPPSANYPVVPILKSSPQSLCSFVDGVLLGAEKDNHKILVHIDIDVKLDSTLPHTADIAKQQSGIDRSCHGRTSR